MSKMLEFKTANLAKIDQGRVAAALDDALKQVLADCDDRPTLKAKRKVTLKIEIVPVADQSGQNLADIETKFVVGEPTIPVRESRVYQFQAAKHGDIVKAGFVPAETMEEQTIDWIKEQTSAEEIQESGRPRPIADLESNAASG